MWCTVWQLLLSLIIFFHIFKYSLFLKLAGLCYRVKVLKCLSFCDLCFGFKLVAHDNSDMALWICYSVPEYYDYGHGTSEEAYDSYGKVYSIFSRCVKSNKNICHWQFRNYFHTLFFISLILLRPNKIDLCNFRVSFGLGPENWTDAFQSKLQSQLLTVTGQFNSNNRVSVSAWISFTVLNFSVLDVLTILCICCCHVHNFNQQGLWDFEI